MISTKCTQCGKRQLNETIIKSTKCEINGRNNDEMITYSVAADILDAFCGEAEMPNDDKEIFLLSCKKLKITTTNFNNIVSLKKVG